MSHKTEVSEQQNRNGSSDLSFYPHAFAQVANSKAPVYCSRSITINAHAAKVWEQLTAIDRWPTWQPDIKKAKLSGTLAPQNEFRWKTGGTAIRSTLHTVQADRFFGWTGKTAGLFAVHNWVLIERGATTEVVVEESLDGLLARWFKKSFSASLAQGMERWLQLLKTTCER